MRDFGNGAIRSSALGKCNYYGTRHPLVELSYAKYMEKHTITEDGTKRENTNWWGSWKREVSLQSMIRHIEDLQALEAGYRVFKVYTIIDGEKSEETFYIKPENADTFLSVIDLNCVVKEVFKEETTNAIKFNCNSYLLKLLYEEQEAKDKGEAKTERGED